MFDKNSNKDSNVCMKDLLALSQTLPRYSLLLRQASRLAI